MTTARLTRTNDRIIAGVCGGIANYLGWDPALVRLLYVLVSIFSAGFPGVLVYIILWIVMPDQYTFNN
jgi:phage shock protein C